MHLFSRSVRFVLPGIGGIPSKVLTLDELSHVVKNIQNMELVHEIAVNPEFKLTPHEPSGNRFALRTFITNLSAF